jgi:hypothetical protein
MFCGNFLTFEISPVPIFEHASGKSQTSAVQGRQLVFPVFFLNGVLSFFSENQANENSAKAEVAHTFDNQHIFPFACTLCKRPWRLMARIFYGGRL